MLLKKILFSIEIFVVSLIMVFYLWMTIVSSERQKNNEITEVSADQIKNAIEYSLNYRVSALLQLRSLWLDNRVPRQEEFVEVCREVSNRTPGIQAIEFRDTGNRVWVEPLPAATPLSSGFSEYFTADSEPARQGAIKRATDNGVLQLSSVLGLARGGKGFAAIVPVQQQNKTAGLLYGVFTIDDLFSLVFDTVFKEHYDCAVYEGKAQIFATDVSLTLEGTHSPNVVQKNVSTRGLHWEILIRPKDSMTGYVAMWVLILGVVASVMLGAMMWMFSGMSEQEELYTAQREITHAMASSANLKNTFRFVGDNCLRLTGVDRCGIFIWHEAERRFDPAWISSDEEEDIYSFLNLQLHYGNLQLINRLVDEKQDILAYDKEAQTLIASSPRSTFKVQTLLAIPILKNDKLIGAMTLACVDRKRRFFKRERFWLDEIANQLAIHLECARLEAELQNQTTLLGQKESELDALISMVTTDLRSPLLSLYSMVSMLKNECGNMLSADGRYYFTRIQSSLSRLESLLDGAKAFSGSRPGNH